MGCMTGVQFPAGAMTEFYVFATTFNTGSGGHPTSHLRPRWRMRRAIPPLSQYVFTSWCLINQWILRGVVLS